MKHLSQYNFDEDDEKDDNFVTAIFKAIAVGLMFWVIIILSAAFIIPTGGN